MNALESTSTRPYLIRALYDWCTDNGLTPYVAVAVDDSVQVPREYVKNGEIVLNISFDATSSLKLGNEFIEFKARFAGVARDIMVPIERVLAIYARENGQGMAFPVASPPASSDPSEPRPPALASVPAGSSAPTPTAEQPEPLPEPSAPEAAAPPTPRPPAGGGRPALKRVK
jgi:stringent starvation protein B